ncbi:ABC transporter permease subunit [Sporolactobacillus sp. KGMB 08714]|uniref:ABC transporter permease subunit n=1 Tax=Sporolactobacillus sp. KGMB 08714 TaxID=3064704 RepID=UPI002FBDE3BB
MNIFIRELKANRTALIVWSVCMIIGVLSGMSKYETYSSGGAAGQALTELPRSMRALLGMGSFNVSVMSGYFAFLFSYIEIALTIHAVLLGSGIISKEERDKTTEFLMVKPISRAGVITAKMMAALVNLFLLNLITLISSLVFVSAYNKDTDITGEIITFFIALFLVQLMFLSLGALLGASIKGGGASGSWSVTILLIGYLIAKVTDINEKLDALNVLSPFKYFDYGDIVRGDGLTVSSVAFTLVLVILFFTGTYFFYNRRDLSV